MPLTTQQLKYAEQRNPYYEQQLGQQWAGRKVSLRPVDSPQFALDVQVFQLARQLTADGVLGPKTNDAIIKTGYVPLTENSSDHLIIANWPVPYPAPAVTPEEPGALVFKRGFYREPVLHPKLFVLHWDVARTTLDCYKTLLKRVLSVQFMLDDNGVVFQGVDPAVAACWHAGQVNLISWGCEINDPVELQYQDPARPRPVLELGIRGSKQKVLGFYPEQIAAIVTLCHWVCEFAVIPKQLPSYKGSVGVYDSYIEGPGDEWKVNGFTGVVGHFHQNNQKIDPGMSLWQPLIDSGFKVVSAG